MQIAHLNPFAVAMRICECMLGRKAGKSVILPPSKIKIFLAIFQVVRQIAQKRTMALSDISTAYGPYNEYMGE